jgi:hypothetical protein
VVENCRYANEFIALRNLAEFTNNSACFSKLISLLLRFVSIISKRQHEGMKKFERTKSFSSRFDPLPFASAWGKISVQSTASKFAPAWGKFKSN